MNWKLILQLSLFGLAMGVASVFVIPSKFEPMFWLPIFVICAYLIARHCPAQRFLHGVLLGIANSVWITAAHVLLFDQYIAGHAQEAAMMGSMPLPTHPRLLMVLMGPVVGIVSGVVIGIFALIAGRFVKAGYSVLPASAPPTST